MYCGKEYHLLKFSEGEHLEKSPLVLVRKDHEIRDTRPIEIRLTTPKLCIVSSTNPTLNST